MSSACPAKAPSRRTWPSGGARSGPTRAGVLRPRLPGSQNVLELKRFGFRLSNIEGQLAVPITLHKPLALPSGVMPGTTNLNRFRIRQHFRALGRMAAAGRGEGPGSTAWQWSARSVARRPFSRPAGVSLLRALCGAADLGVMARFGRASPIARAVALLDHPDTPGDEDGCGDGDRTGWGVLIACYAPSTTLRVVPLVT